MFFADNSEAFFVLRKVRLRENLQVVGHQVRPGGDRPVKGLSVTSEIVAGKPADNIHGKSGVRREALEFTHGPLQFFDAVQAVGVSQGPRIGGLNSYADAKPVAGKFGHYFLVPDPGIGREDEFGPVPQGNIFERPQEGFCPRRVQKKIRVRGRDAARLGSIGRYITDLAQQARRVEIPQFRVAARAIPAGGRAAS